MWGGANDTLSPTFQKVGSVPPPPPSDAHRVHESHLCIDDKCAAKNDRVNGRSGPMPVMFSQASILCRTYYI